MWKLSITHAFFIFTFFIFLKEYTIQTTAYVSFSLQLPEIPETNLKFKHNICIVYYRNVCAVFSHDTDLLL